MCTLVWLFWKWAHLIFSCRKSLCKFNQFSFLVIDFGFSHSLFSLLCFQSKIFFEFFFAIRIRAFCRSHQRFFWSMMNFLWLKRVIILKNRLKWSFEMVLGRFLGWYLLLGKLNWASPNRNCLIQTGHRLNTNLQLIWPFFRQFR